MCLLDLNRAIRKSKKKKSKKKSREKSQEENKENLQIRPIVKIHGVSKKYCLTNSAN